MQNGGVLPTSLPAFPLGAGARLYIEQKSVKDTLGELPVIGGNKTGAAGEKLGGGGGEAAKLQKRVGPPPVGGRKALG